MGPWHFRGPRFSIWVSGENTVRSADRNAADRVLGSPHYLRPFMLTAPNRDSNNTR